MPLHCKGCCTCSIFVCIAMLCCAGSCTMMPCCGVGYFSCRTISRSFIISALARGSAGTLAVIHGLSAHPCGEEWRNASNGCTTSLRDRGDNTRASPKPLPSGFGGSMLWPAVQKEHLMGNGLVPLLGDATNESTRVLPLARRK